MRQLEAAGYPLSTREGEPTAAPCTIEVYPHPALLSLLDRDYRVPYKYGRSLRYWPGRSVRDRIGLLLDEFAAIEQALRSELGSTGLQLPPAKEVKSLSGLKRHEDVLDALVCTWVGVRFLEGRATAYGNADSAIWVPDED